MDSFFVLQVLETCNCLLLTNTIVSENQPTENNSTSTCGSSKINETKHGTPTSSTSAESCCSTIKSEESCQSGGCDPTPSPSAAPPPPVPPPPVPPPPPPAVVPSITVYWMMKDL